MRSYLLWGIGEGLWLFIQPLYLKSLGATPTQTGFVLSLWGLSRLLFILPVGVLGDRWGPRGLMLPGWWTGLAGVVILALAPDWRWTAPGYLVYGLSSTAVPVTNLYLAQAARHDPTRMPGLPIQASLTMLGAAYALGMVLTPTLGGWLGDRVGLRAVYLFSVVWLALSTWAITRTRQYPAPTRPHQGYDYHGFLRQRSILAALLLLTLGFAGVLLGQILSSQYLEEVRGFSRTAIGAFGSLNALGTAVFSLLLGRLAAWRGFFASLALTAAAFALLLASGAAPAVVAGGFLLGAYYSARPLGSSVIHHYVGEHQRGLAFALVDTLAGLASVVGTNAAGRLYAHNPAWPMRGSLVLIGGVLVLGALVLGTTRRNRGLPAAYGSKTAIGGQPSAVSKSGE